MCSLLSNDLIRIYEYVCAWRERKRSSKRGHREHRWAGSEVRGHSYTFSVLATSCQFKGFPSKRFLKCSFFKKKLKANHGDSETISGCWRFERREGCTGRAWRSLTAVKLPCERPEWGIRVTVQSHRLYNMKRDQCCKLWTWVMPTCQCRLTNCNEGDVLVGDVTRDCAWSI